MAFDDTWVMSFNNLQELVDTEGFTALATIPVSTQLVGKGHVMTYLDVNPDYFDTWDSIRMVPRALIHKPDVTIPVHKQYYYDGRGASDEPDGMCGLGQTLGYDAYYDGAGDLPVSGDIAYYEINDETPMDGDGRYRILRNTSGNQKNIAVALDGTITVYDCGDIDYGTPFPMVMTVFSSASQACSDNSSDTKEYYHNGTGAVPAFGDIISSEYGDVGAGFWKDISDTRVWIRETDADGIYIEGTYCDAPTSCTGFLMRQFGYVTIERICEENDELRPQEHNGSGAFPTVGDTIYVNEGCSGELGGGMYYWKFENGAIAQVDNDGLVHGMYACP